MRLHRNLVYTVIDSIRDIFNEGVYADKAVEKALKRDKRWGSRDRKFVAETIYEIVRWKRLYAEIMVVNVNFDKTFCFTSPFKDKCTAGELTASVIKQASD